MSSLPILVDLAAVDSMKADLTKSLPNIKSSHRVEALARSLGFASNAALRAVVTQQLPVQTTVSWSAFRRYLEEKEFSVTAKPLWLAAGRVAIRQIMEKYPRLTRVGVGVNTQHYKGETEEEYMARFRRERAAMLSNPSVEEFLRSYSLVSRIPKTKTITKKGGAYRLKHIAEKASFSYPDGEISAPEYVCTGSAIFAAVHAGFQFREYYGQQDVNFNMQQRVIDDLDCEIRPNSAAAQSRQAREARKKPKWSSVA